MTLRTVNANFPSGLMVHRICEEIQRESNAVHLDQRPEHFQRIIEAMKEH